MLSLDEARRLALHAQGLLGTPDRTAGVSGVLARLGAVQLDTISVLARSHELVPYARLGAVGRDRVERAYWAQPAVAFEYWAHAACVLPLTEWPAFGFRRRARAERKHPRRQASAATRADVLAQLRDRGPLTATELGGAKRGGAWWDWSDVKIAAEELFNEGAAVVTERRGWRRVYDLPERALPAHLLGCDLPEADGVRRLSAYAGSALGVATATDLVRYFGLGLALTDATLADAGLVPVRVEGWRQPAWADPGALAALSAGELRGRRTRTTLLSPFDSLVWDRDRTERLFGFAYRLEAYVPKAKRVHGYFAMPVLAGGRLAGRVDPAREGRSLVARRVSVRRSAVPSLAAALRDAADWVGCDAVAVQAVDPPELAAPLRAAVSRGR